METPFLKDKVLLSSHDHPYVQSVTIYTNTKKCNLDCYNCHNKKEDLKHVEYLTLDELDDEMELAKKCGAKLCIICGGEPTLFTDGIIEVLPTIKKHLKIRFDTNRSKSSRCN